jgi:uncharacterized membrane protein YkvA (DUF1232 family)
MGNDILRVGLLSRLARDFRLLFSLFRDYWKGNYRDVSLFSIFLFAIAAAYVLSPFDFLSDFVPVLGQIDDALLLLLCLYLLEKDLYKYREWKNKKG